MVPPGVVTVTLRVASPAVAPIANVAVMCVESCTTTLLTVMPDPAGKFTVAGLAKLVPVRVTGTLAPREPVFGLIEASVGAATPVPLSETGEPAIDFDPVIVSVPVIAPAAVGANCTVIVQLP